jgi:hypothetical protein
LSGEIVKIIGGKPDGSLLNEMRGVFEGLAMIICP